MIFVCDASSFTINRLRFHWLVVGKNFQIVIQFDFGLSYLELYDKAAHLVTKRKIWERPVVGPVYGVGLTQIVQALGQEVMEVEMVVMTLTRSVNYSRSHYNPRRDGQMTARKGTDKSDREIEFQHILLSTQISCVEKLLFLWSINQLYWLKTYFRRKLNDCSQSVLPSQEVNFPVACRTCNLVKWYMHNSFQICCSSRSEPMTW